MTNNTQEMTSAGVEWIRNSRLLCVVRSVTSYFGYGTSQVPSAEGDLSRPARSVDALRWLAATQHISTAIMRAAADNNMNVLNWFTANPPDREVHSAEERYMDN